MTRAITPISQITGRLQQMGQIKLGAPKVQGQRPRSIDTLRFVSPDHDAVNTIAAQLGGTPVQIGHQLDVITTSKSVDVILPPDPLGGTPIYEMWGSGGCVRRCDGETCTVPIRDGDDITFQDQACICASKNEMECKPTVRLSVILPNVTLGGVWNLKTSSWAALHEMQTMVQLVAMAQSRGLLAATLSVEQREQSIAGRKRKFVVPVLRPSATLAEIAAGQGQALALGASPITPPERQAITSGAPASDLSEEQRQQLIAAWKAADEKSQAETDSYLEFNGLTRKTVPAVLFQDVLDLLTVHDAEVM